MLKNLNHFNTKRPVEFKKYNMQLNDLYILSIRETVRSGVVRFIQTSPKGYNFLNIATGKCVFSSALANANLNQYQLVNHK